jgi:cell division protein FtsB
MRAFEEISRISESEQVAKESEFRLQSFQVLARVGAFTSAVIQNQDEADVVDLLERVEKVNRELEKRLQKVKAREEELEDQARKTW